MEFLGIAAHEDYLRQYGDRLIGMHLHDAIGGSDHRALGRGQIDFGKIMEYVRPETTIVLEIHGQASAAEVIRSREILKGSLK
jgi:sugar phosphate isomerase/epimerase